MRPRISSMVKFCLDKAIECRRAAEKATDQCRKQSWLEMEGLWFFIARSYDNQRRADTRRVPMTPLAAPNISPIHPIPTPDNRQPAPPQHRAQASSDAPARGTGDRGSRGTRDRPQRPSGPWT